jgi:hypothetical protein
MTFNVGPNKVREISPFFIIWIFINKNCFMKQIFEILQEERDRILEMHEDATKKQYLTELEEPGDLGFGATQSELDKVDNSQRALGAPEEKSKIKKNSSYTTTNWNQFSPSQASASMVTRGIPKGTKFEVTNDPFKITAKNINVSFRKDGNWVKKPQLASVSFYCKQGKFYIQGEEKFPYVSETLSKALVKYVCGYKKEKSNLKQTPDGNVVGGTDKGVDNTNYEVGSDRNLIASNGKTVFKILKGTRFKIYPEKNGASGKAKFIGGDQSSQNVWFNCNSGKFLIKNVLPVVDPTTNTTIPAGQKTFSYTSDQPFVDFFKKKCENAKSGGKKDDKSNVDNANLSPGNVGRSTVVKPTDTALDTILQKISGAATQKPGEVKQAPQTWEG